MESRERLRARANETIAKAEHDYRIAMHATKAIKQGFIYFIGTDDAELVKIGFTLGDPRRRLQNLQTANGRELRLLTVIQGSRREEAELHEAFDVERERGSEWFILSHRLRMLLWCLRADVGGPPKKLAPLETQMRARFARLIERETYEEMMLAASEYALSKLR